MLIGHAATGSLPGAAVVGVDLFFVLSGFLITALLVAEWEARGAISLRRFYVRRALRLIPALTALLVIYATWVLLWSSGPARALRLRGVWTGALYVSNWAFALGHGGTPEIGHLWSLATEEQFYLLWPCLLLLLLRSGRRPFVLRACIAGVVVLAGLRSLLYRVPSPIHDQLYFSPFTWADSLLTGCVLGASFVWRSMPRRPLSELLAVPVIGYALVVSRTDSAAQLFDGGITLLALACGVVVAWAIAPGAISAKFLAWRPLQWLGRRSYGIYLWHLPLTHAAWALWPHRSRALAAVAAYGATFVVATLSYRLVEEPFLRRKARWSATRSGVG